MATQPFHDKAKSTPDRLDRGLKASGGLPPSKLLPAKATQAEIEKYMIVSTNITMPIETRTLMMRAARIIDSTPTMIVNAIMNRPEVNELLKYIIDEEPPLLPLPCPECGSDETKIAKNPVTKCRCLSCNHNFTKPLDYGQRIPFPQVSSRPSSGSPQVRPVPARSKKPKPQSQPTAAATKEESASKRKWTKRRRSKADLYTEIKQAKLEELKSEQEKLARQERERQKDRTPPKITDEEVLELFRAGTYRLIQLVTIGGTENEFFVIGPRGFEISIEHKVRKFGRYSQGSVDKNSLRYRWFRIYNLAGQRRRISRHKTLWMVSRNEVVPNGYELHHTKDLDDPTSDNPYNLELQHWRDHYDLHKKTDQRPANDDF